MEGKIFEFANTTSALAELSEALVNLNTAAEAKKSELKKRRKEEDTLIKDREARLEILKSSSQNIIQNIDNIIGKLDKVLENDGTSNDNN